MINPGVITLSSKRIGGINVVVEDNIGEAIHFHYGTLRFDLTVKEFIEITNVFIDVAKDLLGDLAEQLFEYDPVFLNYISEHLLDLERILDDSVQLNDMVVYGRATKKDMGWTKLSKSIMYRALEGDKKDYLSFKQDNPVFVDNEERLSRVNSFIEKQKDNVGNIVLLNERFLVLDGQHRASALLHNYGNKKIKVKRFVFRKFDIEYKVHGRVFFCLKRIKATIRKILFKVF